MTLAELEEKVPALTPAEFSAFTSWLDEFSASQWDSKLERDVARGKFDHILEKVDAEFESGKCQEL